MTNVYIKYSLNQLKRMGKVRFPTFPSGSGLDSESTNPSGLILTNVNLKIDQDCVELICLTNNNVTRTYRIKSKDIVLLNKICTKLTEVISKSASDFLNLPIIIGK